MAILDWTFSPISDFEREFNRSVETLRKLQNDRLRNETIHIRNEARYADAVWKHALANLSEPPEVWHKTKPNEEQFFGTSDRSSGPARQELQP